MNKTIVITGASRGIGKALAENFLAEGYFVIGTSTSGKSDLANENLKMLQLDLEKSDSIEKCASEIVSFGKPVDILINNVGVIYGPPHNGIIDIEALRRMLEVNVIGTIDFTQRIIPLLVQGGHIVNISSRQGSFSYPTGTSRPSYKISKAALNMFTKVLAHDLEGKAIVSSVHPGAVMDTGLAASDADMLPKEAAQYIYDLAVSQPETGHFWYKGEKFPW